MKTGSQAISAVQRSAGIADGAWRQVAGTGRRLPSGPELAGTALASDNDAMKHQVLIYRRTGNLGDAIQCVAMSRLLPGELLGVYRDAADQARRDIPAVINGWLGDAAPSGNPNCIFAGVFVGFREQEQLEWIRSSRHPVGVRDPYTMDYLAKHAISSEMIGCATLTFEPYRGCRAGRYCGRCQPAVTRFRVAD